MQQSSTVPTPKAPVPNTPQITGGVAGPVSTLEPARTGAELSALRERRSELSNQLQDAATRRRAIADQLRNPNLTPADRAGLEQRMAVLDQRTAQLEKDITETGRAIVSSISATTRSDPLNFRPSPGQLTAISIVGTIFVLAPLSIAFARLLWRRATVRPLPPSPEIMNRLERMEQGIEAIAIEVERISEGQRFVTHLLGEGQRAAEQGSAAVPESPRGRD